jgi:hypothetical protein
MGVGELGAQLLVVPAQFFEGGLVGLVQFLVVEGEGGCVFGLLVEQLLQSAVLLG